MHPLSTTTSYVRSRKFRGRRRYFRKVSRLASEFQLSFDQGAWWDLWHYHADWPGYGNISVQIRKEHLRALFTVFGAISSFAPQFKTPFQAFLLLDGEDAGQDAVYLHTPNENESDFPISTDDVAWGHAKLEAVLAPLAPELKLVIGSSPNGCMLVYAVGVGQALAAV